MTPSPPALFTRTDAILLALAVAGYALFALVLPGQHPHSAADYTGRARAVEAARAFLAQTGFSATDALSLQAHPRLDGPLLDTLQHRYGRPGALRWMDTDEGQARGALYWRVWWHTAAPQETGAVVRLTPGGQVLSFEMQQASHFTTRPPVLPAADTLAALVARGEAPGPPRRAAEARVRSLLAATAYAGLDLTLDSLVEGDGARAFLHGPRAGGETVRLEVRLDREGHLLRLGPPAAGAPDVLTLEPRNLLGAFGVGLYVVLLVVVFVAFVRRLSERLVDLRAAFRDALWVALAGMGWMVSAVTIPMLQSLPSLWAVAGVALLNALLMGLGTAFVCFAASGAGDSIARARWPDRLASLSLLRMGAWYDGRVGAALVRGFAGAGLVLGALTLALVLLPGVALHLGGAGEALPDEATLAPALFVAGFYTLVSVFQVYAILLVVGGGVEKRLGAFAYALLVLLLALAQVVVAVDVPFWQVLLHLIPAAAAVWLFRRYDALAALVALLAYSILWNLAYAWMGRGVPSLTGALVLVVVLALIFGVGLWAMLRGRMVREEDAMVPSYIRERQHEARMERELEIAHNVQMTFLPRHMPRLEGLDVAALCLPAMEVGGDYYDFIELDARRLAVVIGDVSGKGIEAAFYMTLVKGFVQTLARENLPPAAVLRRVNGLFCQTAPRGTFMSMIYGVVDVEAGLFTFARAGHNPVLLHRAGQPQAEMLQPSGLAIGLDPGPHFDAALQESQVRLAAGDTLVLYTDGFSEAMNLDHALFGDGRLAGQVTTTRASSARHLRDALTHAVNAFMDGEPQHDDMTMVVLRVGEVAR